MMQPGTVPFWVSDSEDAIDRAKDYCRTRGLTPADVKIVKRDGAVMVVVKRECKLKESPSDA